MFNRDNQADKTDLIKHSLFILKYPCFNHRTTFMEDTWAKRKRTEDRKKTDRGCRKKWKSFKEGCTPKSIAMNLPANNKIRANEYIKVYSIPKKIAMSKVKNDL